MGQKCYRHVPLLLVGSQSDLMMVAMGFSPWTRPISDPFPSRSDGWKTTRSQS